MSAIRSDFDRMLDIYDLIQEVRTRMNALEMTRTRFTTATDPIMRNHADGLEVCTYRIAENAINLSEEVKSQYPEMAWHKIRGMRNILAHDYGAVNPEIVWDTVVTSFPQIESMCIDYAQINGIELAPRIELREELL